MFGRNRKIHLSDADFDAHLDWVVESTTKIINKEPITGYVTTVFLITAGSIEIDALVNESSTTADTYDLLYDFGKRFKKKWRKLQAVFVAAEGISSNDQESIVVAGYTPDGRANVAHLDLVRDADSIIRVMGAAIYRCSDKIELKWRRNPAVEFMRGLKGEPQ